MIFYIKKKIFYIVQRRKKVTKNAKQTKTKKKFKKVLFLSHKIKLGPNLEFNLKM